MFEEYFEKLWNANKPKEREITMWVDLRGYARYQSMLYKQFKPEATDKEVEEYRLKMIEKLKQEKQVLNNLNNKQMMNPKHIISNTDMVSVSYNVPTYKITEEGLVDAGNINIDFCKGSKDNPAIPRQEGVLTETLLEVCRQYLTGVNVGEMSSRETSMAITKIDEALMWIDKRRQDRELRNVLSTYNK